MALAPELIRSPHFLRSQLPITQPVALTPGMNSRQPRKSGVFVGLPRQHESRLVAVVS